MTELEQAILDFVHMYPKATILDVSAEFDLSLDEAEVVLHSIHDKMKDKGDDA